MPEQERVEDEEDDDCAGASWDPMLQYDLEADEEDDEDE